MSADKHADWLVEAMPLTADSVAHSWMNSAAAELRRYAAQSAAAPLMPLTDGQIDAIIHSKHFDLTYPLSVSDNVCLNWYRLGLRDGEHAHKIGDEA